MSEKDDIVSFEENRSDRFDAVDEVFEDQAILSLEIFLAVLGEEPRRCFRAFVDLIRVEEQEPKHLIAASSSKFPVTSLNLFPPP